METQLFYPHIKWNASKKFLLRFAIIFFGLLILPILSPIAEDFYPWVGSAILHLENPITVFPNGSGDTTYNYVEVLTCFVLGFIGASIWSIFNKKEKNYDTLMHWFLIFCRYYVGYSLILYGYSKVFCLQFPAPSLGRLLQPYGESSPMGIAWTFIGASKAYGMFSGFAELIGGLLLLFRRTAVLGSIFGFVVMFNVMMLNYCYDIPVKLYSTQLVLLAFIIMLVMGHNTKVALIYNKPTEPIVFKPLFMKPWLKWSRVVIKSIVLFFIVFYGIYESFLSMNEYGSFAPKPALYGIYKPTHLVKNSDTLRLYSDSTEWKYLVVDMYGASIRQLNDRKVRLVFEADTVKKIISMHEESDSINVFHLTYKNLTDTTLQMNGIYKKDTIVFTLAKVNLNSFRLVNRGFHWVNEYPFNK